MSEPTRGEIVDGEGFATIEEAFATLRRGLPILVLDDADRENEGDVILAAELLTERWTAWMVRHTSGYLCVPMTAERADALELPMMVPHTEDRLRTAYTLSADAATGVTTGISAHDRTRTARVLADPGSTPSDLTRPGHMLPLRARPGGVLERGGHTEAAVDLCRLAGLQAVGVLAELVHDDGTMMRTPDVLAFGAAEGLPVIIIDALRSWRRRHDRVSARAHTHLPLDAGTFEVIGYEDLLTGAEHLALVSPHGLGDPGSDAELPLVRVHSECLTGDVFASRRCDCGPQLQESIRRLGERPGVVIYLRGQEGRGVGLVDKLRAYHLQDEGADTVDAQVELGLPVDDREYGAAAAILTDLGLSRIRLLTNNPDKWSGLREGGIEVAGVEAIELPPTPDNIRYLRTKRDRMGHLLHLDQTISVTGGM